MLVGRAPELAAIDALLEEARDSTSGSLVLRGEPGIGKSVLLGHAADRAGAMQLLRVRAFESEQGLPYAGLSSLLLPVAAHLDEVPAGQRRALATALGLAGPGAIDRFAAYAATLSLLAAVAGERPVLVLVDDAHWLDAPSSEALIFTARRLGQEGIAMLLASRDQEGARLDTTGLRELRLDGLDRFGTAELLQGLIGHGIPAELAAGLTEVTAGNPLALCELARTLSTAQLSGAEPLPTPLPLGADIVEAFGRRIAELPEATQRALVVVAAADGASTGTLDRALGTLGLSLEALGPAELARLVAIEGRIAKLCHPLVGAAVYHRAQSTLRREVHAALAAALDAPGERSRRAWHLAAAAVGPDEAVAVELEAAGAEARGRGAPVSAGIAIAAAASLTSESPRRAERLLLAADELYLAGSMERAGALLDQALPLAGGDPRLRARIEHSRARGEMLSGWPARSQQRLRAEAERVLPVDRDQATAMLVDACVLLAFAGRPREMLEEMRRIAPDAEPSGDPVSFIAGWTRAAAELYSGDYAEGRRLLDTAEVTIRALPLSAVGVVAGSVGIVLSHCEEHERGHRLLADCIETAQREGLVQMLPLVLSGLSDADFRLGRWAPAYAAAAQSAALAHDTGEDPMNGLTRLAYVEAATGRTEDCRRHGERALEIAEDRGSGSTISLAGTALGLLELSLGHFEAAIERLEPTGRFSLERGLLLPGVAPWAQELAEAYLRVGDATAATKVLATLEQHAIRSEALLAHAAVARCRGLMAGDDELDEHFVAALALHDLRAAPFERARTELCFGERLRRAGRRAEAREPLRRALGTFDALGARPWSEHALRELHATGERARRRAPDTAAELTPQELQVALLVADGATNKEAAAALFVSPKTIEAHLLRVYRKLGVHSRSELARRMLTPDTPAGAGTATSPPATPASSALRS
jgi:DNA-binding CsgD family transcriptional regulator